MPREYRSASYWADFHRQRREREHRRRIGDVNRPLQFNDSNTVYTFIPGKSAPLVSHQLANARSLATLPVPSLAARQATPVVYSDEALLARLAEDPDDCRRRQVREIIRRHHREAIQKNGGPLPGMKQARKLKARIMARRGAAAGGTSTPPVPPAPVCHTLAGFLAAHVHPTPVV